MRHGPNLIAMEKLVPMKLGAVLALLALCYGFGLGGVFGAFEEDIKAHLKAEGEAVLSQAYGGDTAKMQKVADKSWVYFKRAHLHANGLGTAALALILLLAYLPASSSTRRLAALALGAGAVLYPLFWMWAGTESSRYGGHRRGQGFAAMAGGAVGRSVHPRSAVGAGRRPEGLFRIAASRRRLTQEKMIAASAMEIAQSSNSVPDPEARQA